MTTILGRHADGLFWMARYIERAENMARLVDAGHRLAMTNLNSDADEWYSVLVSAGVAETYAEIHGEPVAETVIDFLLRDVRNPSSVRTSFETARMNARAVRIALTREVWEAVNVSYLEMSRRLAEPVRLRDLPGLLERIKSHCAFIRGTLHGTQLRNPIFDFFSLGTFIERADNTARILDVKYWVLLPEHSSVGSALDNLQWASILRSVSAHRAFAWEYGADPTATRIVDFLVLNRRQPRSLAFCYFSVGQALDYLNRAEGEDGRCHETAQEIGRRLAACSASEIIENGVHEFLESFIADNNRLALEIRQNFRFHP